MLYAFEFAQIMKVKDKIAPIANNRYLKILVFNLFISLSTFLFLMLK